MSGNSRTLVRSYNADALARLRAHLQGFSEAQLLRAVQRARVTLVRRAEPIAKRDIRSRYQIKAGTLAGKFNTVVGSTQGRGEYVGLQASARKISLLEFGGRWRGRKSVGATAQIRTDGPRKTYASAFIATIKGRRAIRVRSYVTPGGKRHGRHPLRMLRGPSPLEMLLGEDMAHGRLVSAQLLDVYQTEIHRQIELLRKQAGA